MDRRCALFCFAGLTGCQFLVPPLEAPAEALVADLGGEDLTGIDLVGADFAGLDFAPPPDLTVDATGRDQKPPPDFALPMDSKPPPDFMAPPDFVPPPDLMAPPDQAVDPCSTGNKPPAGAAVAQCVIGNPPTIDGNTADWLTNGPAFITVGHSSAALAGGVWSVNETMNDMNLSFDFALKWDATYLYVVARVYDDRSSPDIANNLGCDDIAVYLDPDHSGGATYGPNDHLISARSPDARLQEFRCTSATMCPMAMMVLPGVNAAVLPTGTSSGWTMEMRIPWPSVPAAGSLIGFDIQGDDDDFGPQDRTLVWKATSTGTGCMFPWCEPATMGTGFLGGR